MYVSIAFSEDGHLTSTTKSSPIPSGDAPKMPSMRVNPDRSILTCNFSSISFSTQLSNLLPRCMALVSGTL